MTVTWVPEKFAASGGLAATGFYNLLGRPRLDPLAVLVREAAQNSWDARDSSVAPVRFTIDGKPLTTEQHYFLTNLALPNFEHVEGPRLQDALNDPEISALYISDRNTLGLGGPLQADVVDNEDVYDWVDFVLNVGKANTQGHTGGTYGYGKTISYVVSRANTIVIHTHTKVNGQPQSRLISCAIGKNFSLDGSLYTGRHWWGKSSGGTPHPVTGEEADDLAAAIGMPQFVDGELGTNIMIVAPDFGGRTPLQGMNFLAESALWHLWPKMVASSGHVPMDIALTWDSETVGIPKPEDRPPLDGFAQAFRQLVSPEGETPPVGYRHTSIQRKTPHPMQVGDLATVPLVKMPRPFVNDGHNPDDPDGPNAAAMITGDSHHVALLRTPELVVEYWEGPASPETGTEWAGVFRCTPELDGLFAKSEPPTHDYWSPDLLTERADKNIVTKAMRDIKSAVNERWGKPLEVEATTTAGTTAIVADALAHLVGQSSGAAAGRPIKQGNPKSPSSQRAKVEVIAAAPVIHDGVPATKATVRLTPRRDSELTRVFVKAGVALDSASMDSSLDPELRLIQATAGLKRIELHQNPSTFKIRSDKAIDIEILVARSASTSVMLDISAETLN